MATVLVPAGRLARWFANFEARHGVTALGVDDGALHGAAADGSWCQARPPFDAAWEGTADVEAFAAGCTEAVPAAWGLLLVRRGGFAVARCAGPDVVESKVGRRHVQGRTKAGGQSQQRFARRRDNQARQAWEAAADHAARLLDGVRDVVAGGDRTGVEEVLADPRLRAVQVRDPWLDVPDPRRAVLDAALRDAVAAQVEVHNADRRD